MSPQVHETIAGFRAVLDAARADGAVVGFVPTMGYLHDGHTSLMVAAHNDADLAVASIFVNPLQFAANEDLAAYPRDLERDLARCGAAGVTHVLVPSVEEMYPEPVLTTVRVDELSERMEGAARPTHFAGVATVVAKLFNIVGPCRAYFGEKDFQQLAVVRRLVVDLSFPVEVVGCPIVREPDGVAMSSRNVYLTPDERATAPVLLRALQAGAASILAGGTTAAASELMAAIIDAEPLAELDYAEVVNAANLAPAVVGSDPSSVGDPPPSGTELRLLVAARLGRPRLLDNLGVIVP